MKADDRQLVADPGSRSDEAASKRTGPPEPEPVVIADPDPAWSERFAVAARELRAALGSVAARIDHIGSTAVAGLPAKDVIDMQVSLQCFEPAAAYDAPLGELGYVLLPDHEEPQHLLPPAGRATTEDNIHLCERDGPWERRHLLFRDYLRATSEAYKSMRSSSAR